MKSQTQRSQQEAFLRTFPTDRTLAFIGNRLQEIYSIACHPRQVLLDNLVLSFRENANDLNAEELADFVFDFVVERICECDRGRYGNCLGFLKNQFAAARERGVSVRDAFRQTFDLLQTDTLRYIAMSYGFETLREKLEIVLTFNTPLSTVVEKSQLSEKVTETLEKAGLRFRYVIKPWHLVKALQDKDVKLKIKDRQTGKTLRTDLVLTRSALQTASRCYQNWTGRVGNGCISDDFVPARKEAQEQAAVAAFFNR
jgi:hypothetical protein